MLATDSSDGDSCRFDVVDPRSSEAVAALQSYFAELAERFDDGFNPGDSIVSDAAHFDPPAGVFVLARCTVDSITMGCGAVQVLPDGAAEIKRMWISPLQRGAGLGKRMLHELEEHALELGSGIIRLDTNDALTEAVKMYRSNGYAEIERYNDNPYAKHWFEKVPCG